MFRKGLILLLCALLAVSPVLAETGQILDGRWLCSDIVGNVTADTPAELKDDFALYVNKDWILQAVIAPGEASTSSTKDISRSLQDQQIALMKNTDLPGHDAELVRKLYALVSDWDYRNAQGVEPAMPIIEALNGIDSMEKLLAYLKADDTLLRFLPLVVAVGADFVNPDIYMTQIGTPSLILKDSAEYTERTQAGEQYYQISQQTGKLMLPKLGYSEEEADAIFENAMAFETLMAAHIKPNATHYASDYIMSILNYYTPETLTELAGDFPILDMVQAYGFSIGKQFLVTEPDYIASLQTIFTEENVELIRDWLILKSANSMATSLDQETMRQAEAIENSVMGVTGESSEDDIALAQVKGTLSIPMDNLYIQTYCSEKMQQDIMRIIDETIEAYHEVLESADWLSDETKAKAIEKLDTMQANAVFPTEMGDWSALDFAGPEENGSLLATTAEIQKFLLGLQVAKIDQPVDKKKLDQLTMPTATVNAFYNPQNNSINILAGILQGEIYNEDMSEEQMLAAIGTVIGHEISHAFDTNGAQYDKDGAVANWWTEEDYTAFQARAAKLAAWYDGFIPFEGANYSGQQVQTEVIADMGGMKCMLAIAAKKDNFDYDAFFRQYATIWREQSLLANVISVVARDSHPMNYLRTNATLAQFNEFLSFYGIQEGDGMYIAPEDRVAVW